MLNRREFLKCIVYSATFTLIPKSALADSKDDKLAYSDNRCVSGICLYTNSNMYTTRFTSTSKIIDNINIVSRIIPTPTGVNLTSFTGRQSTFMELIVSFFK